MGNVKGEGFKIKFIYFVSGVINVFNQEPIRRCYINGSKQNQQKKTPFTESITNSMKRKWGTLYRFLLIFEQLLEQPSWLGYSYQDSNKNVSVKCSIPFQLNVTTPITKT